MVFRGSEVSREAIKEKHNLLREVIRNLGSVVVAYSGGVDSTLLVRVAHEVLGTKMVAVLARSPLRSAWEHGEALRIAATMGIECTTVDSEEMKDPAFTRNPPERCYLCKKELFTTLRAIAEEGKYAQVADGTNLDDHQEYRPGIKALQELGIKSPLHEARLTKAEVRVLSRELGLLTWDKPSYSCLASRVPYGENLTHEKLSRIEKAETYLRLQGFGQLRVRAHQDLARIEVPAKDIGRILEGGVQSEIIRRFKEIGFTYVTLDLEGYRSGSMDEALLNLDRRA